MYSQGRFCIVRGALVVPKRSVPWSEGFLVTERTAFADAEELLICSTLIYFTVITLLLLFCFLPKFSEVVRFTFLPFKWMKKAASTLRKKNSTRY